VVKSLKSVYSPKLMLAQDGQVILLDEPFTGVGGKTEEQIIVCCVG
jgi:ABC-type uncharacterized transport system ATPase subunit